MLGIESSCDDTGVAVVRASDGAILGQVRRLWLLDRVVSAASSKQLFVPASLCFCTCLPVLSCNAVSYKGRLRFVCAG